MTEWNQYWTKIYFFRSQQCICRQFACSIPRRSSFKIYNLNVHTLVASLQLLLCLVLLCGSTGALAAENNKAIRMRKNIIDKLLRNYTRQNSPHGDRPTKVELGIYINSFYSISEQTMDYSVNIYLRQQWHDPRLRFNKSETGNRDPIKLEDKIWEKLWIPDVFFRNEKKADFHMVTIPNRLVNLHSDGKVWYVMKISATLSCMMQLQKYPLDTQTCPMMLESFGHTMETVIFKWLVNKSVEKEEDMHLPQFILKESVTKDCSKNYTTGAYPCLQVDFILQRDIGYFVIQVYIPTILIVILSWVAFWINTEAIPARVSLGLLTVLTMTTQSSGAAGSLPRVSYIKAIDVWMSVCLIFVFTSLLEFAVVNVYSRKEATPKRNRKLKTQASSSTPDVETGGGFIHVGTGKQLLIHSEKSSPSKSQTLPVHLDPSQNRARKIDKISRRLFPLSFLLFNVIYWVMYVIVK